MRDQMQLKESQMYSLGNYLHHHVPILFKLCSIGHHLSRPGWPVGEKLACCKRMKIGFNCGALLETCWSAVEIEFRNQWLISTCFFGPCSCSPISWFCSCRFKRASGCTPVMVTAAMDWENDPVLAKVCAYFDNVLILAHWVSTLAC